MKSDPEMSIPNQNINYTKRYGKIEESQELDKNSKKSKISEKSKKSKKSKSTTSSKLIMYNDFLNTDPEKNLEIKDIDYSKRYGLSDEQKEQQEKNKQEEKKEEEKTEEKTEEKKEEEKISQHSKKSKISLTKPIQQYIPMTFDTSNNVSIHPDRIVITDEKEKENLSKILCSSCQKFPLEPKICSECNYIFCDDCLKGKTKCPNCNSIFKQGKLTDELNHLYSVVNIKCCYAQCGCEKLLPPYELLNHQETCKNTKKKCNSCQQEITYENYINHINSCQHNLKKCDLCGYSDTDIEFNKTNQVIQHMRHILIPEIHSIIRNELQQFFSNTNNKKSEPVQQTTTTTQPQGISDELDKKLFDIQQLLLNIQPNDFIGKKDDVGTMIKVSHLEKKIKSIQLINTVPSKIDNAFECDNKFCIINTFKKDNFICYPNLKYGIDIYNLSTGKIETIIPKAHESNITCMATEINNNKSLTYLATASYDRSIKVYTIENKWKKIRSFREIFNDYSTFSIDMFYNNKEMVIIAGNENSKQIKILYPEKDDINSIKFLTMSTKIFCVKHNLSNLEEFFVGNEEGIYLYSIFNIPGINEGKDSNVNPDKTFIDNNEDKAKHLCMAIIEEDKNLLVEGDSLGNIRVWSIKDKQMMKKFRRGILKFQINSIASWNGRFVIAGSRDGKISIFDISDGIYIGDIGQHQSYVYCVKCAEHWKYEKMIASCGLDGDLKIWASKD